VTSNYTYDPLYELTQVTQGANTTESYTYDLVGNRLSSLGVSPYVNNTSNELTSTPNASYTYDFNGNTTTKTVSSATTNYSWDYENRLGSVTLPGTGGSITFKYDPLGRRVQKAFTQNSTTTTTNYLYDGSNAVADIDQNGSVLARYAETQNIDEPLAELRSGTTSYYEADGLGSVTSLSSGAGAIANTYTYDSFGKLTASTGSITNRFQYTAREFDSESGLYYYRARYYDSASGRFLSEDPIGVTGGLDFYVYTQNNPVELLDPSGLQAKPQPIVNPGPINPTPRPVLVPDPEPVVSGGGSVWGWLSDVFGVVGMILGSPTDLNPNEPIPPRLPDPRTIRQPDCPNRGCTCTCRADADATMEGNIKPGAPLHAFGTATASSCAEAAKAAKRIATRALGMKPKHIPCKCAGN
jgi:RHS repeat-associated protein